MPLLLAAHLSYWFCIRSSSVKNSCGFIQENVRNIIAFDIAKEQINTLIESNGELQKLIASLRKEKALGSTARLDGSTAGDQKIINLQDFLDPKWPPPGSKALNSAGHDFKKESLVATHSWYSILDTGSSMIDDLNWQTSQNVIEYRASHILYCQRPVCRNQKLAADELN